MAVGARNPSSAVDVLEPMRHATVRTQSSVVRRKGDRRFFSRQKLLMNAIVMCEGGGRRLWLREFWVRTSRVFGGTDMAPSPRPSGQPGSPYTGGDVVLYTQEVEVVVASALLTVKKIRT